MAYFMLSDLGKLNQGKIMKKSTNPAALIAECAAGRSLWALAAKECLTAAPRAEYDAGQDAAWCRYLAQTAPAQKIYDDAERSAWGNPDYAARVAAAVVVFDAAQDGPGKEYAAALAAAFYGVHAGAK